MAKRPSFEDLFPGLPPGAKSLGIALPGVPAGARPGRRIGPLPAFAVLDESGLPGPWEVVIRGWRPTTLNTLIGSHPAKTARLKRGDAVMLGRHLKEAGCPRAARPRRLALTIVLGHRQRGPDPDAFDKSLRDGLVRCGALVDDGRKWVEPSPVRYERGPTMGTRIALEDLPTRSIDRPGRGLDEPGSEAGRG